MATYALTEFLRKKELEKKFEGRVAPYLKYLRLVLGDIFFKGDGFVGEGLKRRDFYTPIFRRYLPHNGLFGTLHHVEEGGRRCFRDGMNHRFLEEHPDRVEHYNLERIRQHLFEVEGRLLGSLPRRSSRQDAVTPVGQDDIVPFPALLGEEHVVSLGTGGIVGGYDRLETPSGYCTPVYGEDRPFPEEEFNLKLARVKQASGARAEAQIFAGNPLKGSLIKPGSFSWQVRDHEGLPTRFYDKFPEQEIVPRISFTTLMPDNAVYIITPDAVVLFVTPLCEVTTDESDTRIVDLFSRVHHSLLPLSEGPRLEQHHAAFLAVKP